MLICNLTIVERDRPIGYGWTETTGWISVDGEYIGWGIRLTPQQGECIPGLTSDDHATLMLVFGYLERERPDLFRRYHD